LADGVEAGETHRELVSRVQDVLAEQPVVPVRELAGPAKVEEDEKYSGNRTEPYGLLPRRTNLM